jgi:hypothetical protein
MVDRKIISDMGKYIGWKRKRYFGFLLIIIFGVVFYAAIPTLVRTVPELIAKLQKEPQAAAPDPFFPDCSVLKDQCKDTDCSFYNSCDGAQKDCRIYDCGSEYGIFIRKSDGTIQTKKQAKPDTHAIETQSQACTGKLEILAQGCEAGKFRATVKVTTKDKCELGNFVVTLKELGNVSSEFQATGDGTYTVTVDRCGTLTRISPVTKDGMFLEMEGSRL